MRVELREKRVKLDRARGRSYVVDVAVATCRFFTLSLAEQNGANDAEVVCNTAQR